PAGPARSRPGTTMTTPTRRAGRFGPRWLLPAAAVLGLCAALAARGQDRPKSDEFSKFENMKSGNAPVNDPAARDLLDKVAKYYAGRLTNPDVQRDGMSAHVQDFIRRLPPANRPYDKYNGGEKAFVDEFGKAMITQLEP